MATITKRELAMMLLSGNDDSRGIAFALVTAAKQPGELPIFYVDQLMREIREYNMPEWVIDYERVMFKARYQWLVDVGVFVEDERGGLHLADTMKGAI